MNEKSHVSLEQRVCLVCVSTYETGAILVDRGLRQSLEHTTTTGWGLCPEHERLHKQGFIALVEIDPEKSGSPQPGDRFKPESVRRTGQIAHLKRDLFHQIFTAEFEENLPCIFVSIGVIDTLKPMFTVN